MMSLVLPLSTGSAFKVLLFLLKVQVSYLFSRFCYYVPSKCGFAGMDKFGGGAMNGGQQTIIASVSHVSTQFGLSSQHICEVPPAVTFLAWHHPQLEVFSLLGWL